MKDKLRKSRIMKALIAMLAAVVCVCTPIAIVPEKAEAANVTISVSPEYKQSIARNMLNPLNIWRRQRNWYYNASNVKQWIASGTLPNLKYDYTLEKYAMLRAAEIAVNFDHTRPNGTRSSGLIGNGYNAVGENIYASTSSSALDPSYVLTKFKEEDLGFSGQGHRRNMLSIGWTSSGKHDLNYDSVGFSCVKYGNCYYWVQIFGRSSNGVNTNATSAINGARATAMTLDTSTLFKKGTPDFSHINNTSLNQGTSTTLGSVYINIGLGETWPNSTVTVAETPTWSVANSKVLSINSNIAYGNAAGTSKATAREALAGKSKTVTFTVNKSNIKNGFVKEGNYYHFYRNGVKQTGWVYLTAKDGQSKPHWSYFEKGTGNLYTGWHYMSTKEGETTPHWSYFGSNGWLRTGWTYLTKADGQKIAHWSYFGSNGWMRTGWQYLTKADGQSTPHWSYFGSNGWMRTGWHYLTKADGQAVAHFSYFGSNGWMRTGWQYLGKADGQSTPHWSYFGSRGWLATGKYRINGKVYTFSTGGWLVSPKSP